MLINTQSNNVVHDITCRCFQEQGAIKFQNNPNQREYYVITALGKLNSILNRVIWLYFSTRFVLYRRSLLPKGYLVLTYILQQQFNINAKLYFMFIGILILPHYSSFVQ